jgi:hypothetical protein
LFHLKWSHDLPNVESGDFPARLVGVNVRDRRIGRAEVDAYNEATRCIAAAV